MKRGGGKKEGLKMLKKGTGSKGIGNLIRSWGILEKGKGVINMQKAKRGWGDYNPFVFFEKKFPFLWG